MWYSVIVLAKDPFECEIVDERHFKSYIKALIFKKKTTYGKKYKLAAVIIKMQGKSIVIVD